jgi:hypothetical protein
MFLVHQHATELSSRIVSSRISRTSTSHAPYRARRASCRTPWFCHYFGLQRVAGERYSPGRNRHAAPVCRIRRMRSKQARFDAQGRPGWPFCAAVPARVARSIPSVRPSTVSVASSSQKPNLSPTSSVSTCFEPELIYETCSELSIGAFCMAGDNCDRNFDGESNGAASAH